MIRKKIPQQLWVLCNLVHIHMKFYKYQLQRFLVSFFNFFFLFAVKSKKTLRLSSFTFDLEWFAIRKPNIRIFMIASNPYVHNIESQHSQYDIILNPCPTLKFFNGMSSLQHHMDFQ